MTIYLHKNDLPDDIDFGRVIAIDTEATGLHYERDRLCVVQISAGDDNAHLIQFDGTDYKAPHLKKILADQSIQKIFHLALFDVIMIYQNLDVMCENIYCTKIASRIGRTFTRFHGLKNLCQDLLDVKLNKQQQTSDWAVADLSMEQQEYAAADVLYLHQLKGKLDEILLRENRMEVALKCFDFLPNRCLMELKGWGTPDIFTYEYQTG